MQTGACIECTIADPCQTSQPLPVHISKTGAVRKCTCAKRCQRGWQLDGHHAGGLVECLVGNGFDALFHNDLDVHLRLIAYVI